MESLLKEKVVLISGAGRGIGAAAARLFAAAGARVVLTARSTAEIEAVAAQITADGGKALAITADIA
ncbi:MAG: SDR family NAD(P)-dependent oxidoreductase, partial [Calditrichaeota bacterium]|nr:SDR family NAD(P)-dependent oxidoreductase [Calditrichota bacterium]